MKDGLADSFDGFGGRLDKRSRSGKSMRDSHIGTYGTLVLIFVSLSKFTFLLSLPSGQHLALADCRAHSRALDNSTRCARGYLMRAPKARANW